MRYVWMLSLLLFCHVASAVDIFGTDYYFRDSFVRVVDDERGTSLVLMVDDFFDESTGDTLKVEQYEALEKVTRVVKRHSDVALSITGHSDNILPQGKRYQVSDAQARSVTNFLLASGVDPNRIFEVGGEGDLWPVSSNDTMEGRHLNRRVEITFLRKPPGTVTFIEKKPEKPKKIKRVMVKEKKSEVEKIEVKIKEPHKEIKVEIDEVTEKSPTKPVKTTTLIEVDVNEGQSHHNKSHQSKTSHKNTKSTPIKSSQEGSVQEKSGWNNWLNKYILR